MARIRKWQEALIVALAARFFSVGRAWPLETRNPASAGHPAYSRLVTRVSAKRALGIELGPQRPYVRLFRASLAPMAMPLAAGAAADRCSSQSDFFDRADTLWEQFAGAVVRAGGGAGVLKQVDLAASCTFLLATADQIFSHELTLAFLSSLRRWAKDKLAARHASTPQIHVYVNGCRRDLAQDATPARWHYLYSLTRGKAPNVRVAQDRGPKRNSFGISLSRVANFQLPFNRLLVHETLLAYALDGPRQATAPLQGIILLHGYMW